MGKNLFLWCRKTDGATAIEYGLIVAGISVVLAAVIFILGDDITSVFETLSGYLRI